MAVQWSRLQGLTAEGSGPIPHWRTKTPQAMWYSQKEKTLPIMKNVSPLGFSFEIWHIEI